MGIGGRVKTGFLFGKPGIGLKIKISPILYNCTFFSSHEGIKQKGGEGLLGWWVVGDARG